jgi:hypothetical protein
MSQHQHAKARLESKGTATVTSSSLALGPNEERSLSIERVLTRAIDIVHGDPIGILGVGLALGSLPVLLSKIVATTFSSAPNITSAGSSAFWSAWTQGAIVYLALASDRGTPLSVNQAIRRALWRVIPLTLQMLIFGVGFTVGLLLFVVPGLMLATRWAVAPSALLDSDAGIFGAFERSAQLTRGARWRVLALSLLLFTVSGLLTVASSLLEAAAGPDLLTPSALLPVLAGAAVTAVSWTFLAVAQAALYLELLERKEGPSHDKLTEVFS